MSTTHFQTFRDIWAPISSLGTHLSGWVRASDDDARRGRADAGVARAARAARVARFGRPRGWSPARPRPADRAAVAHARKPSGRTPGLDTPKVSVRFRRDRRARHARPFFAFRRRFGPHHAPHRGGRHTPRARSRDPRRRGWRTRHPRPPRRAVRVTTGNRPERCGFVRIQRRESLRAPVRPVRGHGGPRTVRLRATHDARRRGVPDGDRDPVGGHLRPGKDSMDGGVGGIVAGRVRGVLRHPTLDGSKIAVHVAGSVPGVHDGGARKEDARADGEDRRNDPVSVRARVERRRVAVVDRHGGDSGFNRPLERAARAEQAPRA